MEHTGGGRETPVQRSLGKMADFQRFWHQDGAATIAFGTMWGGIAAWPHVAVNRQSDRIRLLHSRVGLSQIFRSLEDMSRARVALGLSWRL